MRVAVGARHASPLPRIVHAGAGPAVARFVGGGGVENPLVHGEGLVAPRVRTQCETVAQVGRWSIEQIQRRHVQQPEDGLEQAGKAGVDMRDVVLLEPRTGAKQNRAVRVDVIDAALRIVFRHEDRHLLPPFRAGEIFQNAA